jgi:predicted secreted protein
MRIRSLCLALLVAFVAASAAAAAVVPLGERSNGTTVRVRVGDVLVIRLSANASTGYAWTFTSTGGPVAPVVSSRYVPAKSRLVGAGGTFVARLAVRAVGHGTLALAYRRTTRPPTPAARTFRVKVVARRG